MPEVIRRGIDYSADLGREPTLLDLYLPDGVARPPLVVWIHGGGFVSGDRVSLPATLSPGSVFGALTAAGLACASVDYRLAPAARYPAPIADVRTALAFLQARAGRYGYDGSRLGLWGESAGGLLALLAGLSTPGVRAIVAWYPVTDILAMPAFSDAGSLAEAPEFGLFDASPKAVPELAVEASPITHVTAAAPPTLLVHGEADSDVPPSQSRRMHERMTRAGAEVTLRTVPGAGHCFAGHPDIPGLINEAVDFLGRTLRATVAD
jgi:acetyl esterase/lipase